MITTGQKEPVCVSPPRCAVSTGHEIWPEEYMTKFPCPVCEYLTLKERYMYSICPVCFWEDDGVGETHDWQDITCGPNHVSFLEAVENFKTIGASEPEMLQYCRKPLPEEIPA